MHPQEKGSRRGTTNAYNINGLVDREMVVAAEERSYERCALETATAKTGARAPQFKIGSPVTLAADAPRFATRSIAADGKCRLVRRQQRTRRRTQAYGSRKDPAPPRG
jgi:hypothetical protein